jgi:hypothetical protein
MAYTTIDDPSEYFTTTLYTGNESTNAITNSANAGDFQPDWAWFKSRNSATHHRLYDSSRGALKNILSSAANTEATTANSLTSFDSNGFTLGSDDNSNQNTKTFVAWQWKANGGTTSSNTDGDITSTVQANTTAGFSIVTFTGNATAGQTVGHGLGVKPEFIFAKNRSNGNNWNCYVEATDNTGDYTLTLNGTGARSNSFNMWNDTAPTSSVITLGDRNETNGSSHNMVFYCFHSIKGYSKFGKYTGNITSGSDGAFVYTGFKPAWIMVKSDSNSGQEWVIFDNKRDTFNQMDAWLYANATTTEDSTGDARDVDFLSNGFKFRNAGGPTSYSGRTYIYMAFAEHPFVSSKGVPVTAR